MKSSPDGLALLVTRLLRGVPFGVGPADLPTLLSIGASVLAVPIVATYVPARRATRVDPNDRVAGRVGSAPHCTLLSCSAIAQKAIAGNLETEFGRSTRHEINR